MTAADSITLNGNSYLFKEPCSVSRLLEVLNMADTPAVVEHNGTALFPQHFQTTVISPGDTVEIVSIVAGG